MNISALLHSVLYLAKGAAVTVGLSIGIIAVSAVTGLFLALIRLYGWKPIRLIVSFYNLFIRGIPLFLLLIGSYFSLPYMGINLPLWLVVLLVGGLYFASYMMEVFRAVIQTVPLRQWDAGRALGMRRTQVFTIVILPQIFRPILPPFLNIALVIVKNTSLVSSIGGWELVAAGREIGESRMEVLPAYLLVAIFYFLICSIISQLGHHFERKMRHA